jgi:hypothetical protein
LFAIDSSCAYERGVELAKSPQIRDVPGIGPQGWLCMLFSTTSGSTHLLKLRPEFVERVAVRSIGYGDVVNLFEASDVELNQTFEN